MGEDAMELFQSVWIDCFDQLHSLRDVDSLPAWLIRITVRKCYRFREATRIQVEVPMPDYPKGLLLGDDPAPELIERLYKQQLIRMAVERLSKRCQQVVQAHFFEESAPSYASLAASLGLSENSIGFTRDRCLERLGVVLEQLGYDS